VSAAPIRRTPMSRHHAALGAHLELEAGWEIPAAYEGDREHLHTSVGLADLTPRAKIDVRGRIEGPLGVAGDGLVARIAPDWALVLDAPGAEEILLPKLEHAANAGAMVTDATHLFAGFALVGPMLDEALARLTSWDPDTLRPGEATGAPIGEVRAVVARRELGVPLLEVYTATEFGRYAWETFIEVVAGLGGGPVGWNALRAEGWR
jgi:glycine cleavage system aminomethyltransferase T